MRTTDAKHAHGNPTGTAGQAGDDDATWEILRVRADNPGPMTLSGTNSYVLAAGDEALLVDPGPALPAHLAAMLDTVGTRTLRGIVLTHHHHDHSELLDSVEEWALGVPVYAVDPRFSRGVAPVVDGQVLSLSDGSSLRFLLTPGHTRDSLSVLVGTVLLAGDTVLGEGTTVILHPDGRVGEFLATIERFLVLVDTGRITRIEPAHGPSVIDPAKVLEHYRAHRLERIAQVEELLDAGVMDPEAVRRAIYPGVGEELAGATRGIVAAQLAYVEEKRGTRSTG